MGQGRPGHLPVLPNRYDSRFFRFVPLISCALPLASTSMRTVIRPVRGPCQTSPKPIREKPDHWRALRPGKESQSRRHDFSNRPGVTRTAAAGTGHTSVISWPGSLTLTFQNGETVSRAGPSGGAAGRKAGRAACGNGRPAGWPGAQPTRSRAGAASGAPGVFRPLRRPGARPRDPAAPQGPRRTFLAVRGPAGPGDPAGPQAPAPSAPAPAPSGPLTWANSGLSRLSGVSPAAAIRCASINCYRAEIGAVTS